MHPVFLALMGLNLLAVTGDRLQNTVVPEKCFYYRIAVATLEIQQPSADRLELTLVEVYRQGPKVRVVGERGEVWMTDGERAVFFYRDARKGWLYPSLPDGLVLLQLGGIAFPFGFLVTERIPFPTKPLRTEEVGSSICTVWDTDTLWPMVGVSNDNRGRLTIWVPREEAIPIGFQRLRLSIENKLVVEARLIEAREVSGSEEIFKVGKDVALVTINKREELLNMVNLWFIKDKN
ncbi:MAG: hypothetical protein NZ749_12895 [bacterium]|nr:hypothetical protein [bacterium]